MFEYCIELGMSEDEAGRRLCAASVARRFPAVYRMLDAGELCLSVVCKLKQYLTDTNRDELLKGVAGMSYRRAEAWLAARFPRPDAPSVVRRLPQRMSSSGGATDTSAQRVLVTTDTATSDAADASALPREVAPVLEP